MWPNSILVSPISYLIYQPTLNLSKSRANPHNFPIIYIDGQLFLKIVEPKVAAEPVWVKFRHLGGALKSAPSPLPHGLGPQWGQSEQHAWETRLFHSKITVVGWLPDISSTIRYHARLPDISITHPKTQYQYRYIRHIMISKYRFQRLASSSQR